MDADCVMQSKTFVSPADNSLGEEAAALRDGHMRMESFIVDSDDSSLAKGGGGVGDDSECAL